MKFKAIYYKTIKNEKERTIHIFVTDAGDFIRIDDEYVGQIHVFEENGQYILSAFAIAYGEKKAFISYKVICKA